MSLRSIYARVIAVDTGAFIALTDPNDGRHDEAVDCMLRIAARRYPLITTLPTVHETHRHLLYTRGRLSARNFLLAVFDGSITIERTTTADDMRAIALIERYADVRLSFVDAVTMAVMERLGVASVFSFDDDFLITGFLRVPPVPT